MEAPGFLQPPMAQPGPDGGTNKTGWGQAHTVPSQAGTEVVHNCFRLRTDPPGERPSHTPQKTTCSQRSANPPAVHLQRAPHGPHPNISGTDSNEHPGPHTRRNSSSDRVTSRGVPSSPARVLQEWTTGPGTALRGQSWGEGCRSQGTGCGDHEKGCRDLGKGA